LLGGFLLLAGLTRLDAQVTATISGTATDASGAAIVGATIQATNVQTNVSQSTVSGAQGRYKIADLPVGEYSVKATMSGFETVLHKGITLTVGANPVVDFLMPVGKVSETVNVESQVSQVETTSAAVSALLSPQQMAQLPLNGRNYEQLLSLAPGVQTIPATAAGGGGSASLYGAGTNYSIAGSRPEGQAFLLDSEDVQDFYMHGAGSEVVGTSLGMEAIQEFQVLTNTYSAQFGGTGGAISAVTKSGTNTLHGSAYDYLRNSAMDSRNYFDGATIPLYHRNQFGGSLGGAIKKDKLFFFANYEGLRSSQGYTETAWVPDANALQGMLPCNDFPVVPAGCTGQLQAIPGGLSAKILPFLGNGALPAPNAGAVEKLTAAGLPTGLASYTTVSPQVVSENYVLGRIDYTLGSKDTLFGRYVSDRAYQDIPYPFSLMPTWPEIDHTPNQYFTVEEKRLLSANKINMVRFSVTRTVNDVINTNPSLAPANDPMQFYPGSGRPDGQIDIPGVTPIGTGRFPKFDLLQNKFGAGDDFFWMHGAHSLKIGASIARVQSMDTQSAIGGIFMFGSLESFLATGVPSLFQGVQNPSPQFTSKRYFHELDFNPYFQDDWKISSKLTLNLGLRWEVASNATCLTGGGGPCYAIEGLQLGTPAATSSCPTWSTTECGFTAVSHVLGQNPNWKNIDPRIGLAWDPFGDHKTSIRAGFGLFHEPIAPRTFGPGFQTAPPSASVTAVGVPFPYPASGGNVTTYSTAAGYYYNSDSVPYAIQYNLTVQRDVGHGMMASLGYIGSSGVHLFSLYNFNQPYPSLSPTSYVPAPINCISSSCYFNSSTPNPNKTWSALNLDAPFSHSSYNGMVASLNRQMASSLVGQVSYTWSRCIDNGSVSSGLEQGGYMITDSYNEGYDRGPCTYNINQSLAVNSVYSLPFKGNRLVSGWQVSPILSVNSGLPVDPVQGLSPIRTSLGTINGDRPNYVPGCDMIANKAYGAQKYVQWINTACFTPTVGGVLGDLGRDAVPGPGFLDLDFAVHKDTKITERLNAQFRAEFFNIINHTNLGNPIPQLFQGPGGSTGALAAISSSPTAGQIISTTGTSRQIQLALKLVF
jgi:hypothetical protein